MDTHWFTDQSAKNTYVWMRSLLDPVIAKLTPGYELSYFGVKRNEHTGEVILKLHLNPFGKVRAHTDNDQLRLARRG